jgi:hypothetical protein
LVGQDNLNDVTPTPTLSFEATDDLSGILAYSVYVDGEMVKENVISPYTFEKLAAGPHRLKVVAIDKAGNKQSAELPVIITSPQGVKTEITSLFEKRFQPLIFLLIATNILTLIIFFIFWERRRKKEQKPTDPVASIQAQIDKSLEDLKVNISRELKKFSKSSTTEMSKTEGHVASNVGGSISKTKRRVDQEISQLRKIKKSN